MSDAFEPVESVSGNWSNGLLLLCDHASNAVPARYESLGLAPEAFQRHIAYDIGARDVTLGLARRLNAPALLTTFSRLLIDANRGEDDPTLVMRLSDGTIIPGNHPIDEAEIARRIGAFHRPYHCALANCIDNAIGAGVVPAIFSVHSFTDRWKGVKRPWDVALLWDNDPRFTGALKAEFLAHGGLTVGDNEPYDGALRNDTMHRHCTRRGLAHTLIEIRQDMIGDAAGVARWVNLLEPMLARVNALAELHQVRHFGSRTDSGYTAPGQSER